MKNGLLTCLILDDEQASVNILTMLLKKIGGCHILGGFTNYVEAEKQLVKEIPDIIFLDIMMPGINGLDLVDSWRSKGIRSAFVIVTGYGEYAVAALRKSAYDYLTKPIDIDELSDCLVRVRCKERPNEDVSKPGGGGKIRINTRNNCFFLDPKQILYSQLHLGFLPAQRIMRIRV